MEDEMDKIYTQLAYKAGHIDIYDAADKSYSPFIDATDATGKIKILSSFLHRIQD